ncbi:hypothetical protein H2248_007135 [Termitomyces sp. 'cryptogamus']|nr:hypothetical protein H2248_007135 [Termitomyces sp. 'cryptogamus']
MKKATRGQPATLPDGKMGLGDQGRHDCLLMYQPPDLLPSHPTFPELPPNIPLTHPNPCLPKVPALAISDTSPANPNDLLANPNDLLANPNDLLANPNDLLANPNDLLANPGTTPAGLLSFPSAPQGP